MSAPRKAFCDVWSTRKKLIISALLARSLCRGLVMNIIAVFYYDRGGALRSDAGCFRHRHARECAGAHEERHSDPEKHLQCSKTRWEMSEWSWVKRAKDRVCGHSMYEFQSFIFYFLALCTWPCHSLIWLSPGGLLIFNDRWWDAYQPTDQLSVDTLFHPVRLKREVFEVFLREGFDRVYEITDRESFAFSKENRNFNGTYFIGRKKVCWIILKSLPGWCIFIYALCVSLSIPFLPLAYCVLFQLGCPAQWSFFCYWWHGWCT